MCLYIRVCIYIQICWSNVFHVSCILWLLQLMHIKHTDLSRGGQQVDGVQKHPATARLLALIYLQKLHNGSAGRLCGRSTHTQTESLTRLTVCACGSNPFSHVSLCVTGLIWGRTLSQLEVMTCRRFRFSFIHCFLILRGQNCDTPVSSQRTSLAQKNIIFCSNKKLII